MPQAPSRFAAIFGLKCPQCRKGNLFEYPNAYYHPTRFNKMHTHCPKCRAEFSPEPGFFIGAMYISYAFNVAMIITALVVTIVLFDPQEKWIWLVNCITPVLVFFPLNYRVSRSVYLHLFGDLKFDPHKFEEVKKELL